MKVTNNKISTIVLVGGQGSRFSNLNEPPKHLTKLNKNLILNNIMNYIYKSGFRHFIFPLGFKKNYFIKFFNSKFNQKKYDFEIIKKKFDHKKFDKNKKFISYFNAGKKTKKITRVFKSINYTNNKDLLVIYGDDLANVKLDKVNEIYNRNKRKKVIVTVFKKNSQYGHLKVNAQGKVSKFIEKPPFPYPINIGFYFINTDVLKRFYNKANELETKFLPSLVKKNLLLSYEHTGYFYSINDKKELLAAKKNLKNL